MAKKKMKKSTIDRYMKSKYGINLDIPNISFSTGNNKLPENTLIINFTTAIGCPAWNECLVKHACYARATEKRTPSVYDGNDKRSLFWLTTQYDETLLSLMMDFARSYCFNYTKAAEALIEKGLFNGKMQAPNLAIKMSKMQLDDPFFTPEIMEVMKEFKRIDNIRLNENGDFVGQWLVDAWDREAGLYQPYGVNVSAYTCRHLNFQGIKNIILNTSYQNGKGNIARSFIALPESVYDALDETYSGNNNELIYIDGIIKPNPQPLYNADSGENLMTPNGKMYYKCPCGREIGNGKKVGCYQCNLCYQPKNDGIDLYVFVKAHGTYRKELNGYDLIKNNIGVSKNFFKNYKDNVPQLQESIQDTSINSIQIAQDDGIKGVTNNAIISTNEHFKELNNKI